MANLIIETLASLKKYLTTLPPIKHGSVKNGCISDRIVAFQSHSHFHWTMLGGRVREVLKLLGSPSIGPTGCRSLPWNQVTSKTFTVSVNVTCQDEESSVKNGTKMKHVDSNQNKSQELQVLHGHVGFLGENTSNQNSLFRKVSLRSCCAKEGAIHLSRTLLLFLRYLQFWRVIL